MMKKGIEVIFRFFLIVLVVSPYFLEPLAVTAAEGETLGDLRKQLTDLENKKSSNQNSANNTQAEINAQNAEIAAAYSSIDQAKNDIVVAEKQIETSEKEIDNLSEQVSNLIVMFEQIDTTELYLEYVTGASSMTDMIMRMDAVNQIIEHTNTQITTMEQLIVDNEKKQLDLIKKQDDLEKNIVEYEAKISSLNVELANFTEITEDIDDQIKNQRILIEYYEDIGCGETQNLTECVAIANNASWLKPTNYGVVTSLFGYRSLWGRWEFHNAVDIGGNYEGTPIYSATSGTVAAITYRSSCGGNKVYVHSYVNGQAYTIQYLHLLNYNVKVGDKVTTSTQIGTVGGGGQTWWDYCSTGAHLHFGVATGFYLGGGADGYSSYNEYVARAIEPPGFPGLYESYYSRTQWFN